MSQQELLLLGLLKESPKHGYEIKKKIKEIPSLFAGVALKSIYYPLAALEKEGLISRQVNKYGRRPTRFVYALTPKGERRFKELLSHSLLELKRPEFSLDLSIYFLKYLEPGIARRRLRGRMHILEKLSRSLSQTIKAPQLKTPPPLIKILEHNLAMLKAEQRFLAQFIRQPL